MSTRSVDGRTLPGIGTWEFDPNHTIIGFVARHLMVAKVRGRFPEFEGEVVIAERPEDSSIRVVAQTASITTGVEDRDSHLRSPDFLDVEKWPTMTFQSTAIEQAGNLWKVTGDLTIRDQTHPITLEVEFLGVTGDPWGGTRAGFEATGEIERKTWGLVWNVAVEGGWLVSEKVQLEIEAELIAPS